jgi:hypothetical protein
MIFAPRHLVCVLIEVAAAYPVMDAVFRSGLNDPQAKVAAAGLATGA